MSIAFLCRIVDNISTDQKLTNCKLSALAAAFTRDSYSPQPFSARTNAKRDTLRLLMHILKGDSSDDDQCLLPTHLEKMTKSELVVFARDHSIPFERRTTVTELWSLVVTHVLSTACLQRVNINHWDDSPKGCAQSVKIFLLSGQQVESVSNPLLFLLSLDV